MSHVRFWLLGGVLVLLGLACAFPRQTKRRLQTPSPETPALVERTLTSPSSFTATTAPSPSPTVPPSPTPTPTEVPVPFQILQLYLRYDSQEPEGTFEMMVCNMGEKVLQGTLEATFEVNGISYTTKHALQKPLRMYECTEIYSEAGFTYFRITQPGEEVDVTVRLALLQGPASATQVYRERLVVRDLTTQPSPEALRRYQACIQGLGTIDQRACTVHLPDYPLAEYQEIAKRWGIFTVIAPREREDVLAPWLFTLRTCTPEVQRFLGIEEFEVPVLVARLDPTLSDVGALAMGASIVFPNEESRDSQALAEIMTSGCAPGQVASGMNTMFVHEIVHTLIALYTEGEWASRYDGTALEGTFPGYFNMLPLLLNEGLANWVATEFDAQPFDIWACTPDGLEVTSTRVLLPYMPLYLQTTNEMQTWMQQNLSDDPDTVALLEEYLEAPEIYWKASSAQCFWNILAAEEGREVVGRVLTQLRAYPQKDTCEFSFVDVALAPVVRPETLQKMAHLFGMRSDIDACRLN